MLFFFVFTGSSDEWRVPLLFALCTNKTTLTYKTIFEQIKLKLPNYTPAQINVDFELAAINAIKEVFPNTKIQGCFFHLKQSVVRNLNSNHLKTRLETDLKFSTEIRQMVAVAFLPPDQVSYQCFLIFIKTNRILYSSLLQNYM